MRELSHLFANNRAWAGRILTEDPEFFRELCQQQAPRFFRIGCSDSRVPANPITGLLPGEMFVHRNVANVVPPGDLNCLSALQFAADVLQVRHVIVCGRYGCAGIRAVLNGLRLGLIHAPRQRRKSRPSSAENDPESNAGGRVWLEAPEKDPAQAESGVQTLFYQSSIMSLAVFSCLPIISIFACTPH